MDSSTEAQPLEEILARYPNLQTLLEVKLPLIAILAEKEIPFRQVMELDIDSVIVFDKHNSDPVLLKVNNVTVGSGKTIKVQDRFGLHLRNYSQENVVKAVT